MQGYLVLEDGSVFQGKAFGAVGVQGAEVVFNTGMTGYQELLTDPSYCAQIVVMTYPLIGNYGINPEDFESRRVFLRGFVVREECDFPSNWRCEQDLDSYLKEQGVIGLSGVDTRAITRKIRNHGTMRGVIAAGPQNVQELLEKARLAPALSGQHLIDEVTSPERRVLEGNGFHVALLDFGAKDNIARSLNLRGCKVTILPARTTAEEILALDPDGVMLSNGPGDPKDVPYGIETIKALLGKAPIFGICLGHQLLSLALGGDTYKLPFGHRGSNHPVKDLKTGRVYITSQNHGYATIADSLPQGAAVTHINLNDGTVEGLELIDQPCFSVQYHPEAAPGPDDSGYLFDRFLELMEKHQGGK